MPPSDSRRLVVDADVASAAGGESSEHPVAAACRDFLKCALVVCHRLVLSPELLGEWKGHRSNFTRTWLTQMFARRKVILIEPDARQILYERIESATVDEKNISIIRKDFHLLAIAIAADRTIVSMDETVRTLLCDVCQSVREIGDIVWVNPSKATERPIDWLQYGAQPEKSRELRCASDR